VLGSLIEKQIKDTWDPRSVLFLIAGGLIPPAAVDLLENGNYSARIWREVSVRVKYLDYGVPQKCIESRVQSLTQICVLTLITI